MRDAESMLDQLLSTAPERIEEADVRDLLGLADADTVAAFVDHLVRGDGAAGVVLLDGLEERGRDIRVLLDQAVDAIRAELVAGVADPSAVRHDPAALAAAGRRLAAIDTNRAGIGGLRFQLELAMFAAPADGRSRIDADGRHRRDRRPIRSIEARRDERAAASGPPTAPDDPTPWSRCGAPTPAPQAEPAEPEPSSRRRGPARGTLSGRHRNPRHSTRTRGDPNPPTRSHRPTSPSPRPRRRPAGPPRPVTAPSTTSSPRGRRSWQT